jgi:glycosyltransferase involved in cell wall biosynthesis
MKYSKTKRFNLFWGSSYDRGLDMLLPMWKDIKKKFPEATLHICYGWKLFDQGYANNEERMMWKERQQKLMKSKGIYHHGRVGKEELGKIRKKCGIWAYPTYFTEIHCITALDAQSDGCVPVVIDLAALSETVQSGIKVKGDIYDDDTKDKYLKALLELMGDEKAWEAHWISGVDFTKTQNWYEKAKEWSKHF